MVNREAVDEAISNYICGDPIVGKFHDASEYILPEGKRYRALIGLGVYEALGGNPDDFMKSAVGIELTHITSLVFDDMPCMDDSPMRKGRKTIHLVWDEPTALLSGLYLWDKGREYIIENIAEHVESPREVSSLSSLVSGYFTELIQGQELDLIADPKQTMECTLKKNNLFQLACVLPTYLLGREELSGLLGEAGKELSIAYQLFDDVRDTLADKETAGKPVQSDAHNTVKEFGLTPVKVKLEQSKQKILQIFRHIEENKEDKKLESLVETIFSTFA